MVPDATGTASISLFHFLCIREARPSKPAQLINFLSAMIAPLRITYVHACVHGARAPWSGADTRRCCWSLLPGWCSDYQDMSPEHLQMNVTWAWERSMKEGRHDGLWVELSNGPLERKVLNIYCIIYICLISPLLPPVSTEICRARLIQTRSSHAIFKRLGVKERYNLPYKQQLKCLWSVYD